PRLRIENVLGVRVKGRKRGNRRDHHPHGVRVVVKTVQKLLDALVDEGVDRKSTRLNSSHGSISYAVFCLKKKIIYEAITVLQEEFELFWPHHAAPEAEDCIHTLAIGNLILQL